MANSGIKQVLTLQEMQNPYPPGTPTGNTKPNIIGDPDYIAPYEDLTDCPVTADTTCPDFIYTGATGTIQWEISVPDSVLQNVNVTGFRVRIMNSSGSTEISHQDHTLSELNANYMGSVYTGVSAGTYQMSIQYLNSSTPVATCPFTTIITVS